MILKEAANLADIKLPFIVEKVLLAEIAKYSNSKISSEYITSNNYVSVENLLSYKKGKNEDNITVPYGNFTQYFVGDILVGNIRPYLRKIWHSDRNGGTNTDVLVIQVLEDKEIVSRFLYHVLADENFFVYNINNSKGAKMPRGDKQKIMEYKIPIPPKSVQEHIVSVLDKFDCMVNSITEGLPAEIAMREKEYEYYREQLLTFEK